MSAARHSSDMFIPCSTDAAFIRSYSAGGRLKLWTIIGSLSLSSWPVAPVI